MLGTNKDYTGMNFLKIPFVSGGSNGSVVPTFSNSF